MARLVLHYFEGDRKGLSVDIVGSSVTVSTSDFPIPGRVADNELDGVRLATLLLLVVTGVCQGRTTSVQIDSVPRHD